MRTVRWLVPALVALAVSCATRPPLADQRQAALTISYDALAVSGTGLDSARLDAYVQLSNSGPASIDIESVDCRLDGESGSVATGKPGTGVRLAPGESASLPLRLDFQVPAGTAALVPLSLATEVTARAAGGEQHRFDGTIRVEVPRVMAPVLDIALIRIIKDELINTRLRVDLAIHNPNAFGLSFATLDYRLYGEGRFWADGSQAQPFDVPAGSTATASLFLTMNFTDMSRSLLDQVIRLATVNYRLAGAARIDTGLGFLPQFVLPFDMAGRAEVTR